jgi:CDP-glycerol glycerophosphotransferase (TagB/SpsB family)
VFGVDDDRTVVLYAPTWREAGQAEEFNHQAALRALAAAGERHGFLVGFRRHPNSAPFDLGFSPAVASLGTEVFPSAEELLGAVDVLVTDWSSIGTDYLPLARPVVYLDVPPPEGGVGPLTRHDRPGPVVSVDTITPAVVEAVTRPDTALAPFADARRATIERAWGDSLDGRSTERCWRELRRLISERGPR